MKTLTKWVIGISALGTLGWVTYRGSYALLLWALKKYSEAYGSMGLEVEDA